MPKAGDPLAARDWQSGTAVDHDGGVSIGPPRHAHMRPYSGGRWAIGITASLLTFLAAVLGLMATEHTARLLIGLACVALVLLVVGCIATRTERSLALKLVAALALPAGITLVVVLIASVPLALILA